MNNSNPTSAPTPTQPILFSSQGEFTRQLLQCFSRAQTRLQLIDPNFSQWGFDHSETFQALRYFLLASRKNRLQILYHKGNYLERECLRFMPLLSNFSHAIECRVIPRNLSHLTDSFCLADNDQHIVRRYHCDHFRGEAAFDMPDATQVSAKRFADIWLESDIGLQGSRTGL
jgi:hypothetical protein